MEFLHSSSFIFIIFPHYYSKRRAKNRGSPVFSSRNLTGLGDNMVCFLLALCYDQ